MSPLSPRLTIRCANDDLELENWNSQGPINGLVSQASHPVLAKASDLFRDDRVISDLPPTISNSDPTCYKVKTSRHRAAAYRDSDGQIWIVAAGIRKESSPEDFYEIFGSMDSEDWMPSNGDISLHQDEIKSVRMHAWEQDFQNKVGHWLKSENLQHSLSLQVVVSDLNPKSDYAESNTDLLGTIKVSAVEFDGELLGIEVSSEQARWNPEDCLITVALLAVARRINNNEQDWSVTASGRSGGGTLLIVEFDGGFTLKQAQEENAPNSDLTSFRPGQYTHRVFASRHLGGGPESALLNGTAVRSFCGIAFVPRQDPNAKQMCMECERIQASLDRVLRKRH